MEREVAPGANQVKQLRDQVTAAFVKALTDCMAITGNVASIHQISSAITRMLERGTTGTQLGYGGPFPLSAAEADRLLRPRLLRLVATLGGVCHLGCPLRSGLHPPGASQAVH